MVLDSQWQSHHGAATGGGLETPRVFCPSRFGAGMGGARGVPVLRREVEGDVCARQFSSFMADESQDLLEAVHVEEGRGDSLQPPAIGQLPGHIVGEGDAQALIDPQDCVGGGETVVSIGLEHFLQSGLLEQQERLGHIFDPQVEPVASSTHLIRVRCQRRRGVAPDAVDQRLDSPRDPAAERVCRGRPKAASGKRREPSAPPGCDALPVSLEDGGEVSYRVDLLHWWRQPPGAIRCRSPRCRE